MKLNNYVKLEKKLKITNLCWIRNENEFIKIHTIVSLIDWTIAEMQNEKDFHKFLKIFLQSLDFVELL